MRPLRLLLVNAAAALWTGNAMAQAVPQQSAPALKPTVAGWIETVVFPEQGVTLEAKLDTGAGFSSLSVTGLERFRRDGKTWYRFTIRDPNGKAVTLERQSERVARIVRAEVKDTRRPIVSLKVCVAGHETVTDFTLTDRSGQGYQVLIGRKFLANRVLVDSNSKNLFARPCEGRK